MATISNECFGYTFNDVERIEIPEMDGALLTKLLEESQAIDTEEEVQLKDMIGSLEADQIMTDMGGTVSAESIGANDDFGDHGLDDIFSILDSQGCSSSSYAMEVLPESPGSNIDAWYLGACMENVGVVECGDSINYTAYYWHSYEKQMSNSLWE